MESQAEEFIIQSEKWYQIRFSAYEVQIATIFSLLRIHKIEPILIKGWAAGRLYPQPSDRYFSDIDLAVDPELYEEALKLIEDEKNLIDLHKGLRHLDTVRWELLSERSRLVSCGESDFRILSEEDHLRVLAVHWLQDGGAYQHRLRDIYYAVAGRSEDFDWAKCLDVVDQKRRHWIIATIGLAAKYLNLDISTLPFKDEATRVPGWMIKTVEREWKSKVRLQPLSQTWKSPARLYRQVLKRLNPNSIQAMIDVNGEITGTPRIFFKIGSIITRLIESLKRSAK